jgi:hypothetical protein
LQGGCDNYESDGCPDYRTSCTYNVREHPGCRFSCSSLRLRLAIYSNISAQSPTIGPYSAPARGAWNPSVVCRIVLASGHFQPPKPPVLGRTQTRAQSVAGCALFI